MSYTECRVVALPNMLETEKVMCKKENFLWAENKESNLSIVVGHIRPTDRDHREVPSQSYFSLLCKRQLFQYLNFAPWRTYEVIFIEYVFELTITYYK